MIFLWVPETMQRTLEELDWVFAVPMTTFMKYQVTVTLPWWIKRYIFWQTDASRAPLYHFENVAATPMKRTRATTAAAHLTHSSDEKKRATPSGGRGGE